MTKIATLINGSIHKKATADMRLYQLDPPLEKDDYIDGGTTPYEYVIVSAAVVPYSGPETYIFGADAKGEIQDWGEMDGSYRGGLDHEQALRNAGYTVKEEA